MMSTRVDGKLWIWSASIVARPSQRSGSTLLAFIAARSESNVACLRSRLTVSAECTFAKYRIMESQITGPSSAPSSSISRPRFSKKLRALAVPSPRPTSRALADSCSAA